MVDKIKNERKNLTVMIKNADKLNEDSEKPIKINTGKWLNEFVTKRSSK